VIKVHLYGSLLRQPRGGAALQGAGGGAFVHMTSTSGLIGNFGQANYSAAKLGIVALSKSIALDMQKFNVRSNCIAPFAWSRMIGTIPTDTPEQQARVAKIQQMTPAKIAPLAVYLLSDAAKEVSGQIFAVRNNEIFLMSQPRPCAACTAARAGLPRRSARSAAASSRRPWRWAPWQVPAAWWPPPPCCSISVAHVHRVAAVEDRLAHGVDGVLLLAAPHHVHRHVALREHRVDHEAVAGVDGLLVAQVQHHQLPCTSATRRSARGTARAARRTGRRAPSRRAAPGWRRCPCRGSSR
jgi:hypothetical protein